MDHLTEKPHPDHSGCDICTIIANPSPEERSLRLMETNHWRATLRRDQQFLGTTFVTLKAHKESLVDLSLKEDMEFTVVRNALMRAIESAFHPDNFNLSCLMNDTQRDEDPTPHVHWHLKPRYATPPRIAGESFPDDQFGHNITEKQPKHVSPAVSAAIVAAFKRALLPSLNSERAAGRYVPKRTRSWVL